MRIHSVATSLHLSKMGRRRTRTAIGTTTRKKERRKANIPEKMHSI